MGSSSAAPDAASPPMTSRIQPEIAFRISDIV